MHASEAMIVIYQVFVEGKLEAPEYHARTVHDLYCESKYEEFRPRTVWSLSNAFSSAFRRTGSQSTVQGHRQAGKVPGREFPS